MTNSAKGNIAASVHQRLLNVAKKTGRPFNEVFQPTPTLRMYPPETVVAEKVEAMIHFGGLNSRMKDFYDVWKLSQKLEFDTDVLSEAIRQTLKNRDTELIPFAELKAALLGNNALENQWSAFLGKSGVTGPESFHEVLSQIELFLGPLLERIDHL